MVFWSGKCSVIRGTIDRRERKRFLWFWFYPLDTSVVLLLFRRHGRPFRLSFAGFSFHSILLPFPLYLSIPLLPLIPSSSLLLLVSACISIPSVSLLTNCLLPKENLGPSLAKNVRRKVRSYSKLKWLFFIFRWHDIWSWFRFPAPSGTHCFIVAFFPPFFDARISKF